MQIQCFDLEEHFTNFFQRLTASKLFVRDFFGQVEISSGK